jgi:small subunit ribosomal protein S19
VTRSLKKGPYVDENILKKIERMNKDGKKTVIKTWARGSDVSPEMIGFTLAIHNGKKHIPIFINENMVGHKLGEFVHTRMFRSHAGSKK